MKKLWYFTCGGPATFEGIRPAAWFAGPSAFKWRVWWNMAATAWHQHYLTYYNVLCAGLCWLGMKLHIYQHKEIACKLSEKFQHTEHGATQSTIWRFFGSYYVRTCKD